MIDKVPKIAGKRPQPKGGSRKGKPNKATALIKEMIEGALQDVGGQAYLARQADENPAAFMGLLGKILPKDVNLNGHLEIENISDEELDKRLAEKLAIAKIK